MSTRHVILALLDVQPATGYDLAQREAISTHPVWAASHSQIYPALHKLENEGLVDSESSVRGERMQRIVYQITDEGRRELNEWKTRPVRYLPFRDPFRFWAAFVDTTEPEIVFRNIDDHIRRHSETARRMDHAAESYTSGEHPLVQARKGKLKDEELRRIQISRASMYEELAALSRFEIASALRTRKLAEELHPDFEAPPEPEEAAEALAGSA